MAKLGVGVGAGREAPFPGIMGPLESLGRVQGRRSLLTSATESPRPPPLPNRCSEAQGPESLRDAGRSTTPAVQRQSSRSLGALLVPAEGSRASPPPRPRRSRDAADAGSVAQRRRGRRGRRRGRGPGEGRGGKRV